MLDWITETIEATGYWGIAFLMLLENVFPPIPSELIMPLAGFVAREGKLDITLVAVAGTAGSLAGALVWYIAGMLLGTARVRRFAQRYGRWLTLSPKDVDDAQAWFHTHGGKVVFGGRLIPAIRTLISVPAGVSEMSFRRFIIYSTLGTAVWSTLLAVAGYLLADQYRHVEASLKPVSLLVVAGIAVWYLYRVWTFDPDASGKSSGGNET